jgi:hypothetical protein
LPDKFVEYAPEHEFTHLSLEDLLELVLAVEGQKAARWRNRRYLEAKAIAGRLGRDIFWGRNSPHRAFLGACLNIRAALCGRALELATFAEVFERFTSDPACSATKAIIVGAFHGDDPYRGRETLIPASTGMSTFSAGADWGNRARL